MINNMKPTKQIVEFENKNGERYFSYCDVDSDGEILKVTKSMCTPINNRYIYKVVDGKIIKNEKGSIKDETHTTIVDDKKEIKPKLTEDSEPNEVPGLRDEFSDEDTIEDLDESDKIEGLTESDEIETEKDIETKEEEENNMATAEDIRRDATRDALEMFNSQQRAKEHEQMLQEERLKRLALEKEVAGTKEYVDKTINTGLTNLYGKIDKLTTEKSKPELKIDEIMSKIKAKSDMEKINRESEIDCPGCAKDGHKHNLKPVGNGKLKCTGEHCSEEYMLFPTKATDENMIKSGFEGYCAKCGTPIGKGVQSCPRCGSTKGVGYTVK